MIKRIVVVSPYSGKTVLHKVYLQTCIDYVIEKGHAPFAGHYIYPNFLNDEEEEQRELGMKLGWAWGIVANECWVFADYGISAGMKKDVEYYTKLCPDMPVKYISLGK